MLSREPPSHWRVFMPDPRRLAGVSSSSPDDMEARVLNRYPIVERNEKRCAAYVSAQAVTIFPDLAPPARGSPFLGAFIGRRAYCSLVSTSVLSRGEGRFLLEGLLDGVRRHIWLSSRGRRSQLHRGDLRWLRHRASDRPCSLAAHSQASEGHVSGHAVGVYTLPSIFLSCTHSTRHFAPVAYELSWLNFAACSLRLGEQLA
jgi:hypothetical protein